METCLNLFLASSDNDTCSSLLSILEKWSNFSVNGRELTRSKVNYEREAHLEFEIFESLTMNILGIEDFEIEIVKIFNDSENHFKGKGCNFINEVEIIGTVVKKRHIENKIIDSIAFDPYNVLIDEVDVENLDLSKLNNYFGEIRENAIIWFTWDYSDPKEPFCFITSHDNTEKREEIYNMLGLSETYINSDLALFYFESRSFELFKPTICDAGIESAFVVNDCQDHGFACAHSDYSNKDPLWEKTSGRPEAIAKSVNVRMENARKIEFI